MATQFSLDGSQYALSSKVTITWAYTPTTNHYSYRVYRLDPGKDWQLLIESFVSTSTVSYDDYSAPASTIQYAVVEVTTSGVAATQIGAVTLLAPGSLVAAGTTSPAPGVALRAAARFVVQPIVAALVQVLLNAPAFLARAAVRGTDGTVDLFAPGRLQATGSPGSAAALSLNCPGSISVAGTRIAPASATLGAPGRLTADATQSTPTGNATYNDTYSDTY